MAKVGRPPIGPQVTAHVPPEVLAELRGMAEERDQALSAVVRDLIGRALEAERDREEELANA